MTVADTTLKPCAWLRKNGETAPQGLDPLVLLGALEPGPGLNDPTNYEPVIPLSEAQRLEAEVQRLREDAERYRWLRSVGQEQVRVMGHYAGEAMDAAIDTAIKGEKE
jgi:hypothetical protein